MSVYASLFLSMNQCTLVIISNDAFLRKEERGRGGTGENEMSKLGKFGRKRVEGSWVNQIKRRKERVADEGVERSRKQSTNRSW